MFTIGFEFGEEILSQDVDDWKKILPWLRANGCKILYVYYKENNRPIFIYKGD